MIPLSKIQVSPVKEKQFEKKHITCVEAVSYTHLTLPTILRV